MLFVVSGPSGCGKSTLVRRVIQEMDDVHFSVSHTTRKKRPTEEEGRDYYFIDGHKFQDMVRNGRMLEWAEVHGHFYGTSRGEVKKKSASGDVLLDIDVQGAAQVRERAKKTQFIFILPPRFQELKKRLEQRGEDDEETIARRLKTAQKEIRHYSDFDYIVINDKLEQAVFECKAVITAARCRMPVRQKEILPVLASFSGRYP